MHTKVSRLVSILVLMLLTFEAAANNIIVSPIKISRGEEINIPVMCETDEEFVGFQTEVSLPDGLTFVAPYASAPSESGDDFMLNSNLDGAVLRIAGISKGSPYPKNGVLFTLCVKASNDFMEGNILISNTIFSNKEHQEVSFPDVSVLAAGIIPEVENMKLSNESLELKVGESKTLSVEITPIAAAERPVEWSTSDSQVATVKDGVVTAISLGNATVTATCGGKTASCSVSVVRTPVESVTLSSSSKDCYVNESFMLTAKVLPEDATDSSVSWSSSDDKVAKVDNDGLVTALSLGSAVITATSDGKSATCLVNVIPTPVTSIVLSPDKWEGYAGESFKIVASTLPEDATDPTVSWVSSDPEIATVTADGSVTAISVGTAVISAYSGAVYASCEVVVKPFLVESVTLSLDKWEGKAGETLSLKATVSPDNATDQSIIWSSDDEAVAKVDQEGNVTALSVGETSVKATAADGSGASASCKIIVVKTAVESIELSATEWTCHVGESLSLTATILPADATEQTVSWSSSNENVASVSESGKVVALALGEATITASADGLTSSCLIKVTPILVESIILSPENWSGVEGETFEITVTIFPENATDKSISWTSNDENVAKVSDSGVVSVLKDGECVITAAAIDGSGVKSECRVNSISGVEIILKSESSTFDVYTKDGVLIRKNVSCDYLHSLSPDIYIIRSKTNAYKVNLR